MQLFQHNHLISDKAHETVCLAFSLPSLFHIPLDKITFTFPQHYRPYPSKSIFCIPAGTDDGIHVYCCSGKLYKERKMCYVERDDEEERHEFKAACSGLGFSLAPGVFFYLSCRLSFFSSFLFYSFIEFSVRLTMYIAIYYGASARRLIRYKR